jgi:hypothetical protein
MDVFSMELGIWLSFVKTSEFRGGGVEPPNTNPTGMPLHHTKIDQLWNSVLQDVREGIYAANTSKQIAQTYRT